MKDFEALLKHLFLKHGKGLPKDKIQIWNLTNEQKEDILTDLSIAAGIIEED